MGDSYQCKLCRYNTPAQANFQLQDGQARAERPVVARVRRCSQANGGGSRVRGHRQPVHLSAALWLLYQQLGSCGYCSQLRAWGQPKAQHRPTQTCLWKGGGAQILGDQRLGPNGHFVPLTGGTGIERELVTWWRLQLGTEGSPLQGASFGEPELYCNSPILCIVPPTFLGTDFCLTPTIAIS